MCEEEVSGNARRKKESNQPARGSHGNMIGNKTTSVLKGGKEETKGTEPRGKTEPRRKRPPNAVKEENRRRVIQVSDTVTAPGPRFDPIEPW